MLLEQIAILRSYLRGTRCFATGGKGKKGKRLEVWNKKSEWRRAMDCGGMSLWLRGWHRIS
jgi:hypothetical protein